MKLTAETTIFNDDKVQQKFSELIVDADGIRTEVSKKVGDNEVISRINQSAETIKIQADKVAIEGAAIFTSGRLSKTTLDSTYEPNGAVNELQNDLASGSGTTVIDGGHIVTDTIDLQKLKVSARDVIDDAATKATNYISVIDETGITVHPSGTTDDRIQISNGVNVYKDGKLKGEYVDIVKLYGGNGTYPLTEINASAVKIAQSGDNYANVDSDGLQVYQGGSEVASFGSEIVLGSQDEYQTRVSPDSFTMSHAQLGDLYSVELGEDETRNIDVSFTVGKGKTKNNLKVAFTSSVTVLYNWKGSGERITLGTYTVSEWAVGSSKTATGLTVTRKNSQTFSIKNSGSTTVYVTFRITATAPGLHMHWNGSNNLLWSGGGWYMRTSQTVYLDEPVSSQLNGLVLVWGRFSSGSAINAGWNCQYIPKGLITAMEGNDFDTLLVDGTTIGRKIVKVYDDHITGGSDDNGDSSISGSGMTLHPASFVLRFVYGV